MLLRIIMSPAVIIFFGYLLSEVLLPSVVWASESMVKLYVSAWLVRLWLALIGGTVLVVGVMVAMGGDKSDYTLQPVYSKDSGVSVTKKPKLSYMRIGGGLLTVVVGCLFFVSSVFLLPDKQSGYSGIGKVIAQLKTTKVIVRLKAKVQELTDGSLAVEPQLPEGKHE